ncbi:MAG: hypothetical protein ACREX6_04525, partial [Casimicrobiaceae bacterium]
MNRAVNERSNPVAAVLEAPLDAWAVLSRAAEVAWTRSVGGRSIASAAASRSARLIAFARAHSPYYRDLWHAHGAGDNRLVTLPVVTKRALMEHFDDWITDREVRRVEVEAFLADRANIGEFFHGRY